MFLGKRKRTTAEPTDTMGLKKVYYFNHNEPLVPIEEIVRRVCQDLRLEFASQADFSDHLEWRHNCDVAILHGQPVPRPPSHRSFRFYNYLSQRNTSSTNGLRVIFVSSGSLSYKPVKVEFGKGTDARGIRYLLPVRDSKAAGLIPAEVSLSRNERSQIADRWRRLFVRIQEKEILDAWLQDQNDSLLNGVFHGPVVMRVLPALAILCQGYLAAYCESQDGKLPEEVRRALKVMQWHRLRIDPAFQADPELHALRKRLQGSWSAPIGTRTHPPKNPQDAGWWLLPFKRGKSARPAWTFARLSRDLQEEWNNYPSSIQNLLKLIRKPPVKKPVAVAQAYMSIALHLERRTANR